MKYSVQGIKLTEQFEGLRLEAYLDQHNIWTVGYGHTGVDVHPGLVITKEQAETLLFQDVAHAEDTVNRLVKVPLNQNEFDALVDFVYNVGSGNFKDSKLLKYINAKMFRIAALEFERWDRVKGKELAGLLRRRKMEEDEFNQR